MAKTYYFMSDFKPRGLGGPIEIVEQIEFKYPDMVIKKDNFGRVRYITSDMLSPGQWWILTDKLIENAKAKLS